MRVKQPATKTTKKALADRVTQLERENALLKRHVRGQTAAIDQMTASLILSRALDGAWS